MLCGFLEVCMLVLFFVIFFPCFHVFMKKWSLEACHLDICTFSYDFSTRICHCFAHTHHKNHNLLVLDHFCLLSIEYVSQHRDLHFICYEFELVVHGSSCFRVFKTESWQLYFLPPVTAAFLDFCRPSNDLRKMWKYFGMLLHVSKFCEKY